MQSQSSRSVLIKATELRTLPAPSYPLFVDLNSTPHIMDKPSYDTAHPQDRTKTFIMLANARHALTFAVDLLFVLARSVQPPLSSSCFLPSHTIAISDECCTLLHILAAAPLVPRHMRTLRRLLQAIHVLSAEPAAARAAMHPTAALFGARLKEGPSSNLRELDDVLAQYFAIPGQLPNRLAGLAAVDALKSASWIEADGPEVSALRVNYNARAFDDHELIRISGYGLRRRSAVGAVTRRDASSGVERLGDGLACLRGTLRSTRRNQPISRIAIRRRTSPIAIPTAECW